MKTKLILATAIAMAVSAPTWAQEAPQSTAPAQPTLSEQQPGQTGMGSDVTGQQKMESAATAGGAMQSTGAETRASELIGKDIYNAQDEDIGEVDDLIVGSDGKINDVVISVGGFLGMGDKLVAVPYDEIQVGGENQDRLVYHATKEQLEARPEFKYEQVEFSRYEEEKPVDTTTTGKTPAEMSTEHQEEVLKKTQ